MPGVPTIHDLANALPPEERKQLHNRIVKSLSIHDRGEERIFGGEVKKDERTELIRRDMMRLSLWERLRFFFKRLFSSKPDHEAFVDFRLQACRDRIRRHPIPIIGDNGETYGPAVAERFYDLFQAVSPLLGMFGELWSGEDFFESMVATVLESRIADVKRNLSDFISTREMQDLLVDFQGKAEIKKALLDRVARYFGKIPSDLFLEVEDGLLPLYYLKSICAFDYRGFFEQFGFQRDEMDAGTEYPPFKPAPMGTVCPYLEEMHYGVYTARRKGNKREVHGDLLTIYVQNKQPEGSEEKDVQAGVRTISERLRNLWKSIDELAAALPLADMIRLARNDPYYRLMAYVPKLNLRDFYYAALKMRVLQTLDERFPDVRMGVIGRLIDNIFPNGLLEFSFYRSTAQASVKKLGLPAFRYVKSLNVLYNYVLSHFRPRLLPLIRNTARVLPPKLRDVGNRLLVDASAVDDLGDEIRKYDQSFSPDSDTGKAFSRIRIALEHDLSQQRSYRVLVAQKDREAKNMLDRGAEHLNTIAESFRKIEAEGIHPDGSGQQPAGENESRLGAVRTSIQNRLSDDADELSLVQRLVAHLVHMEQGG